MRSQRTPAWWSSRFQIAMAIVALASGTFFAVFPPRPLFGIGPPVDLVYLAGAGLALVGLVWMIRILRGPRENTRHWRYRGD